MSSGERVVTRGIVLRSTETKEADNILTVLTAERGKVPVVARGARRKTSKIAAATDLLAFSELVLYERHGWLMLSEASTIALFDGIRQDVELLSLASYFAEMTEFLTVENVPAGEVLSLLLNSLYALDTLKKPQELVKSVFELKLLSLSGYEPLLDACAVCGAEDIAEPVFDAREGTVLCRKCAGSAGGATLSPGSLAAMRHIVAAPNRKLCSFALSGEAQKHLSAACEVFAETQLEHHFRTLDFYKSLRQDSPAAGNQINGENK